MKLQIAGVVLAGGKSSRMGQDKAQLIFNYKKTLIEQSKDILQAAGIDSVFESSRNGILDKHENKGPLGGLLASLDELKKFKFIVFIPVDMPLLNPKAIITLIANINGSITYFENYMLPVILENKKELRKVIHAQITSDDLSLRKLYRSVNAKAIKNSFNKDEFININSPEQWNRVIQQPLESKQ